MLTAFGAIEQLPITVLPGALNAAKKNSNLVLTVGIF